MSLSLLDKTENSPFKMEISRRSIGFYALVGAFFATLAVVGYVKEIKPEIGNKINKEYVPTSVSEYFHSIEDRVCKYIVCEKRGE